MYHDFLGPRGLKGTYMDTLKPKNSKLITFTVREDFFTFWAILAHSMPDWILTASPVPGQNTGQKKKKRKKS